MESSRIWTVGHSNLTLEAFLELLAANRIERVVDVRRYPSSRRHPHFSRGPLAGALEDAGVDYVHLQGLGGHREARPQSRHSALTEPAFRAYADHMGTPVFRESLERLIRLAAAARTAVMCAEASFEHCHRGLLADRLAAGGTEVVHLSRGEDVPHRLHAAARFEAGRLEYRGAEQLGFADWAD